MLRRSRHPINASVESTTPKIGISGVFFPLFMSQIILSYLMSIMQFSVHWVSSKEHPVGHRCRHCPVKNCWFAGGETMFAASVTQHHIAFQFVFLAVLNVLDLLCGCSSLFFVSLKKRCPQTGGSSSWNVIYLCCPLPPTSIPTTKQSPALPPFTMLLALPY